MKAIVQDTYGSADVLRLDDVDRPAVGPDDVLIRVHAAGVDAGVWHLMAGRPFLMRAMGFGVRILPHAGGLATFLYYAIAGTIWIIPIGLMLPWMNREPTKTK